MELEKHIISQTISQTETTYSLSYDGQDMGELGVISDSFYYITPQGKELWLHSDITTLEQALDTVKTWLQEAGYIF